MYRISTTVAARGCQRMSVAFRAAPAYLCLLQRPTSTSTLVAGGAASSSFFVPNSAVSRRAYATRSSKDRADDFEFDPLASVRHDAAVETAKQSKESIVDSFCPPGAPPSAKHKISEYLDKHPIDSLIVAQEVQITHVQDKETGTEEKMNNLSPCSLDDALEQAQQRGLHLVQMGSREGLAFCRIRDEKPWILQLIAEDMVSVGADAAAGVGESHTAPEQLKRLVDHQFRDVVDAHFIGWKSKKIADDIRNNHPVKLTIKDFQSAEAAMYKLKEMCVAIREFAETKGIFHHFTSIVGNDREASITLSPSSANKSGTVSKTVKHPTEKEWASALKRMQDLCQKAGRSGTYLKSNALKQRNVGATLHRVDKYGRRKD